MKKSKLSIGLVTSFIGALALTSCGSTETVTSSKTSIVDFIGYNSKTERLEINVDQLYREYGESKEGTSMYYKAILESLIRYEYPKLAADVNPKEKDLKAYSRIVSEANDKVKAVEQTAQDNADSNDTDFEDEWEKILESNNVESKKELKEKFIYELEKEALEDWYFKKHSETHNEGENSVLGLRQRYIGVDKSWNPIAPETTSETGREYVESLYPYHVVHILVKLSADATDYTRATITEDEAKKLWDIVRHLVDGQYTFEETSKLSDDTSSSEYGDVELMSTKTSFYNEFKLGTWAFDAILSGNNSETAEVKDIYKAFGVDSESEVVLKSLSVEDGKLVELVETKGKVTELIQQNMLEDVNIHMQEEQTSIPAIPFDVFRQIGLHAEDEKIKTFTPEGSSASLPRNVLFNAFLNFRSPFVITNELLNESSVEFSVEYDQPSFVNYADKEAFDAATDSETKIEALAEGIHVYPVNKEELSEGYQVFECYKDNSKNKLVKRDVISKEDRGSSSYIYVAKHDDVTTSPYDFSNPEILKLDSNNFKSGKVSGLSKDVLCDTNENVVIGVRSTAGIHFMVMRKSVFKNTNELAYENVEKGIKKTNTSLEDYYSVAKIPTDKDYDMADHETYVNIKNVNDSSYYTNRANTIKNDVKSSNYDAAYDYRLYETLLNYDGIGTKLHFSDEVAGKSVIKENIIKTIKQLRENSKLSQEKSINKAWQEYLLQLMNQNELRSDEGMYKDAFVPTTCAFSFTKGNEADWKEGGRCYVK